VYRHANLLCLFHIKFNQSREQMQDNASGQSDVHTLVGKRAQSQSNSRNEFMNTEINVNYE
jgi:hypothetical protein